MAQPYSRHELVWVSAAGWEQALASQAAGDHEARDCVAWWSARGLPLVVPRQPSKAGGLVLGLSAPVRWNRRKLVLHCARGQVVGRGHFPLAADAAGLLAPALRAEWLALCDGLAALGCAARLHGSHGWQLLSGVGHLREGSDLDLLLPVADAAVADAVCQHLQALRWSGPRLDGELLLPGGAGVAWREWRAWRAGAARDVLAKRIDGVALVADLACLIRDSDLTAEAAS